MIYKKDSLTSCLWEGTLYDMLKSAIRGHWDKIILDKSRANTKHWRGNPFSSVILQPVSLAQDDRIIAHPKTFAKSAPLLRC